MSKSVATLGGYDLILNGESVIWPLRPGVMPTIQTFNMAPADALALSKSKRPVELVITPPEGNGLRVQHLWVLNVMPGRNPFESQVTVADRRWFWDRAHLVGRYNMRRNVGVKRILANNLELQGIEDRAFEIAYWAYSLNKGAKHTSKTMLGDVLAKLSKIEKDYWGQTFQVILDTRLGDKIQALPIEDLSIDHPGHQAVLLALGKLPAADVTIDYDGSVIIFSKAAGDEIEIIKAALPEMWGRGHTDLVKNNLIRPKEIHVLFTREVEVRFDFVETADARSETVLVDPLGDLRRMENVLPIPDYQLSVSTGSSTATFPQGSWITFDQAFRSWGNLPLFGPPTRGLDHDLVQRAFIPGMDLWASLGIIGERPNDDDTLSPWVARVAACEKHYRTTFRLNPKWMDRFFSWRAYRLATINIQSGQRGPSMAYGDYALIPSQRSRYRNTLQGKPMDYAINRSAYPTGDNEYLDSTATPSPGVVSVEDHDQGIAHVDYAMDINRSYEMVLPSQIKLDSMPTANLTARKRTIAFNEVLAGLEPPRLSPSFKLAFIISAIPASPNSAQQLHRIVIKPEQVRMLLPEAAQPGLGEADGPIMEVRIGPGVEVARIRWLDSKSTVTEQIFGLTDVPNDPDAQAKFSQAVSSLCLNEGSTGGAAGASLNEIALAEAASIYASLVDRFEGSLTTHLNGGIHLAGWTGEIRHEYNTQGEVLTQIIFPAAVPQMSLFAFLSSSERAIVMRLAQP